MALQRISFSSAVVAMLFCAFTNDASALVLLASDPVNTHGGPWTSGSLILAAFEQ